MFLGRDIRLRGKSAKGKNRIREHGELWTVFAETDKVLFNPQPGQWLFVAPSGKNQDDKSSRWIHADNDLDFDVIIQVDK